MDKAIPETKNKDVLHIMIESQYLCMFLSGWSDHVVIKTLDLWLGVSLDRSSTES